MGNPENSITSDYGDAGLGTRILAGLQSHGVDVDNLTQEVLAEIDHIHGGGWLNTVDLAKLVRLEPAMAALDIGCGIGGPSRYFANVFGCRVMGIDITDEYVRVAAMLTECCQLSHLAEFQCQRGPTAVQ